MANFVVQLLYFETIDKKKKRKAVRKSLRN